MTVAPWRIGALLALALWLPAAAQSFRPGQAIQYEESGRLKDAEFLRLTPDGTQAIIREANPYFPEGSQKAVGVGQLRAKGAAPAPPARPAAQGAAQPAAPGPWKVGDKIQYWAPGWHDGEVVGIGSGPYAGHYKVKADGFDSEAWSPVANMRSRPAAPNPAAAAGGPRAGSYNIRSYGNPSNPLRLGRIALANGRYRYYDNGDKLLGEGAYGFSGATVTWRTGPLSTSGFGGAFRVDGATHAIQLNRVTVALNTP